MCNLAVIPARGGSKRIYKKNIKNFCGKPIIEYSIEAAFEADIFDEIMVSTDSEEIADISKRAGAQVPFLRSELNANDFATTADVILEVLEMYKNIGKEFKYITCIYPTAPFITGQKLKKGLELLKEKRGKMVLPIIKFSFPPQRGLVYEGEKLKFRWPEMRNKRSQDLEPVFHDCGQFYCYEVESFISTKGQITEGLIPIEMTELEVQDIDTIEDWEIAEIKYTLMKKLT